MATRRPSPEMRQRHLQLLNALADYFDPTLDQQVYDKLMNSCRAYLPPMDVKKSPTLLKALQNLEQRGTIAVGKYDELKKIIKDLDVTVLDIINEAEEDIASLKQQAAASVSIPQLKDDAGPPSSRVDNLNIPTMSEVDGGPPMTNVAGACARTHQMAVTGTTLGRDPETHLCNSVGWQFYLDYLASKLSAEIFDMSVNLKLESGELDEIKNRCKANHHEMCFNVLWTWFGRNPDNKKRIKQMNTALKESGRADLATQLMDGKVPVPGNYRYQDEIKDSDVEISSSDALKVGKHLTLTFQRLARYFGLDENNIQSIRIDNNDDIQKQSYNTIILCIKQLKLNNRQQLCNGLAYLEQLTTVSELNKMWCSQSKS